MNEPMITDRHRGQCGVRRFACPEQDAALPQRAAEALVAPRRLPLPRRIAAAFASSLTGI